MVARMVESWVAQKVNWMVDSKEWQLADSMVCHSVVMTEYLTVEKSGKNLVALSGFWTAVQKVAR